MTTAPQSLATRTLAARRYRFVAFLIDGLIFHIAASPIYSLLAEDVEISEESAFVSYLNPYAGNPNWPIELAIAVLFAIYFWLQHALWGQTLGKRIYRLKVVSSRTGETPGFRHAGIRALVYPALVSTPYSGALINLIDALWIFVGPKRQCLHDMIAGTVVVDLADSGRRGSRSNGFLFSLGILFALTFLIVFVSLIMPR